MLGNDFTYGQHKLSDYDYKLYDPENEQQFVGRDVDRAEITSIRAIPNHYSTHYSSVLTLDFLIIKDDGTELTQSERLMSGDDINTIRAWLESPKTPTLLSVEPYDENETAVNYYGLFTEIQPFIVSQQCYGLYLTFTCNSPYGFSDAVEETYVLEIINVLTEDSENLLDESGNPIYAEAGCASVGYAEGTFVNDSAEYNEYMKPFISITAYDTFSTGDTLTIKNVTDSNNEMVISFPDGITELNIDCQKKIITDESGNLLTLEDIGVTTPISDNYSFISSELFSFYWLQFVSGTNELQFTTNDGSTVSEVTISARNIIKSGGF